MRTIDEISIGRDGDMFTLTIYSYDNEHGTPDELYNEPRSMTFLIGLPDQFHAETQRTIGQWLTRAVDERPILMRVKEAAAYLNISRATLDRIVARGDLPSIRLGGSIRYRQTDLDAYIESCRDWPYQPDALTHDAQGDTDLARDLERGK